MTRIVKKKNTTPTEEQEQIKLATWMTKQNILFYAIPNGGYRHIHEAFKFKRSGVKAGVPDLCIPLARSSYHGLYIELKRTHGATVSDQQYWWIDQLNAAGYKAVIAYGFEEAKEIIIDYLGNTSL